MGPFDDDFGGVGGDSGADTSDLGSADNSIDFGDGDGVNDFDNTMDSGNKEISSGNEEVEAPEDDTASAEFDDVSSETSDNNEENGNDVEAVGATIPEEQGDNRPSFDDTDQEVNQEAYDDPDNDMSNSDTGDDSGDGYSFDDVSSIEDEEEEPENIENDQTIEGNDPEDNNPKDDFDDVSGDDIGEQKEELYGDEAGYEGVSGQGELNQSDVEADSSDAGEESDGDSFDDTANDASDETGENASDKPEGETDSSDETKGDNVEPSDSETDEEEAETAAGETADEGTETAKDEAQVEGTEDANAKPDETDASSGESDESKAESASEASESPDLKEDDEADDNIDASEPKAADGTEGETGEGTDNKHEGETDSSDETKGDDVESPDNETKEEETESDAWETGDEGSESAKDDAQAEGTENVNPMPDETSEGSGETDESKAESASEASENPDLKADEYTDNNAKVSETEGENPEGDNSEKAAIFENVSYHQGKNDLGALGTCGPTSIANSLNRLTGTNDYSENAVLHNAMDNNLCHKSDNPYSCGGTTTKDIVDIIDNVKEPESNIHSEVYEYGNALDVDTLAERLDDSGTVAIVGVDSATLWDQRGDVACSGLFQHTDSPSDHWITVDSPIRDAAGNLTGFNIIDSGGGVSEVSKEKFEAMYMGDAGHTVSDPTAILISNSGESGNTFATSEGVERISNYKGSSMESDGGDSPVEASAYSDFKSLSMDEQIEKYANMSSEEIYDMVKNSSESWPVDGYDKVTPENAKDFIVLNVNDKGETSFNLDWPKYGGYDPKTLSSISDLSGKVEVSRDGGDGGYTMGIGRNTDGSYDNNSMRSIPKSSAEVNTGTFDVDKYKESVDIVSSDATDEEKTARLMDMGFDEDSADNMLRDYENWKSRPEIIGDGNIEQGAKMANPDGQIDMKYGVHGKAAEWDIGGVHMEGGAGQMNTVYSWGTCRDAGIITNCGKAKID